MKYYLFVIGCDMNRNDAERIASVFNDAGYTLVSNENEADVLIAVACSVRQKAIDKIYGKANKWNKELRIPPIGRAGMNNESKRPKLILTGCILDDDKGKLAKLFDLVFDMKNIQKLEEFLNRIKNYESRIKNNKNHNSLFIIHNSNLEKNSDYFSIRPRYQSRFSAYVPIMTGCDNFCSYCAVPYTRGREISRKEKDILQEIEGLVKAGYKEITLLGQNVNSYGVNSKLQITNDKQTSNFKSQTSKFDLKIESLKNSLKIVNCKLKINNVFVSLLEKIDAIPGNYWVRFYANHPKDFSDDLIKFLKKSKHFCRYIHLPLQSGDDVILKKMNRKYIVKQYLDLVKKIRKEIPDVTLTTDVIVGFSRETEKQFGNTVKVMKKAKFDLAFISEYSPRPSAKSSKMKDDVSNTEKGKRKRFLNDEVLAKSALENNKKLIGKIIKVLVKEKDNSKVIGSTAGLKNVKIICRGGVTPSEIGDFIDVKIIRASSWRLEGEI